MLNQHLPDISPLEVEFAAFDGIWQQRTVNQSPRAPLALSAARRALMFFGHRGVPFVTDSGRNSTITARMSENRFLVTATSALRNAT